VRIQWRGVGWRAGGWTGAGGAGFVCYLRLAQTRAVNSDGAAQALQAWDLLHGNLLLRGWTTSDVSFYFTELPQYAVVELVRGLSAQVVPVAAALSYTLVVLLAALLAAGRGPRRAGLAGAAVTAGIMLAPQLGAGTNVLLSSSDHTGTAAALLLSWLVLDRAGPRRYVPVITLALLAWADAADSIVLIAGIAPLAAVCALRLARSGPGPAERRWLAALGAGALAAAALADLVLRVIHAAGGFTVRPLGLQVAGPGAIFTHNLPVTGQCLLLLTGADVFAADGAGPVALAVLHLAGTAAATAGIVLAARRWRRLGLTDQVLLAAIAVNLAAFVLTDRVDGVPSAREIAPVLPLAAALAGRQLAPLLLTVLSRGSTGRRRLLLPALILPAAGYLAGLGAELTVPAAPPQAAPLTAWLEAHPLGTGLSGYWEASIVTLTSDGRVAVRPVTASGGELRANPGEVRGSWFDPAQSAAHYVVFFPGVPGYAGFTDRVTVRADFGPPARVYQAGQYTVWYWPANLLDRVSR
jgi:hypothetical protein